MLSCVVAFWRLAVTAESVLNIHSMPRITNPISSARHHERTRKLKEDGKRHLRRDAREGALRGEEVALDLVARVRGRGLAGEQRLGDGPDRALRTADAARHALDPCGRRRVTAWCSCQGSCCSSAGRRQGVRVREGGLLGGLGGERLEGLLQAGEVADDAETVDVALDVADLARCDLCDGG